MTTKNFKIGLSRQKLFWWLLIFLIFVSFSYLYLVNDLIFKAAARENLRRLGAQLTLDTTELENQYLTLMKTINLKQVYALGFEETNPDDATFATITLPHLALGLTDRP
ncbi:MAG: hypothetical protein AAB677_00870 [Patescibacteria group bacterium]